MCNPYRVHARRGAAYRGRRSCAVRHTSLCPRLQMLRAFGLDEMLRAFGLDGVIIAP